MRRVKETRPITDLTGPRMLGQNKALTLGLLQKRTGGVHEAGPYYRGEVLSYNARTRRSMVKFSDGEFELMLRYAFTGSNANYVVAHYYGS